MGEEAADLDWRRFLSAWERCKAEKGGRATWETFSNKFISYNKWNPSSDMRIICVQTGVSGYTFDWVGIYAKFKEVSQCAAPLLWPCMNLTAQKRTEQEFNIVISYLTKIFTKKCTILCSFSSLTSWMTTGQPDRRPPRRDPPCNCCPKPCQQFLLSQRYGPQQRVIIFVVVLFMTSRFFNCLCWQKWQGVWFQLVISHL